MDKSSIRATKTDAARKLLTKVFGAAEKRHTNTLLRGKRTVQESFFKWHVLTDQEIVPSSLKTMLLNGRITPSKASWVLLEQSIPRIRKGHLSTDQVIRNFTQGLNMVFRVHKRVNHKNHKTLFDNCRLLYHKKPMIDVVSKRIIAKLLNTIIAFKQHVFEAKTSPLFSILQKLIKKSAGDVRVDALWRIKSFIMLKQRVVSQMISILETAFFKQREKGWQKIIGNDARINIMYEKFRNEIDVYKTSMKVKLIERFGKACLTKTLHAWNRCSMKPTNTLTPEQENDQLEKFSAGQSFSFCSPLMSFKANGGIPSLHQKAVLEIGSVASEHHSKPHVTAAVALTKLMKYAKNSTDFEFISKYLRRVLVKNEERANLSCRQALSRLVACSRAISNKQKLLNLIKFKNIRTNIAEKASTFKTLKALVQQESNLVSQTHFDHHRYSTLSIYLRQLAVRCLQKSFDSIFQYSCLRMKIREARQSALARVIRSESYRRQLCVSTVVMLLKGFSRFAGSITTSSLAEEVKKMNKSHRESQNEAILKRKANFAKAILAILMRDIASRKQTAFGQLVRSFKQHQNRKKALSTLCTLFRSKSIQEKRDSLQLMLVIVRQRKEAEKESSFRLQRIKEAFSLLHSSFRARLDAGFISIHKLADQSLELSRLRKQKIMSTKRLNELLCSRVVITKRDTFRVLITMATSTNSKTRSLPKLLTMLAEKTREKIRSSVIQLLRFSHRMNKIAHTRSRALLSIHIIIRSFHRSCLLSAFLALKSIQESKNQGAIRLSTIISKLSKGTVSNHLSHAFEDIRSFSFFVHNLRQSKKLEAAHDGLLRTKLPSIVVNRFSNFTRAAFTKLAINYLLVATHEGKSLAAVRGNSAALRSAPAKRSSSQPSLKAIRFVITYLVGQRLEEIFKKRKHAAFLRITKRAAVENFRAFYAEWWKWKISRARTEAINEERNSRLRKAKEPVQVKNISTVESQDIMTELEMAQLNSAETSQEDRLLESRVNPSCRREIRQNISDFKASDPAQKTEKYNIAKVNLNTPEKVYQTDRRAPIIAFSYLKEEYKRRTAKNLLFNSSEGNKVQQRVAKESPVKNSTSTDIFVQENSQTKTNLDLPLNFIDGSNNSSKHLASSYKAAKMTKARGELRVAESRNLDQIKTECLETEESKGRFTDSGVREGWIRYLDSSRGRSSSLVRESSRSKGQSELEKVKEEEKKMVSSANKIGIKDSSSNPLQGSTSETKTKSMKPLSNLIGGQCYNSRIDPKNKKTNFADNDLLETLNQCVTAIGPYLPSSELHSSKPKQKITLEDFAKLTQTKNRSDSRVKIEVQKISDLKNLGLSKQSGAETQTAFYLSDRSRLSTNSDRNASRELHNSLLQTTHNDNTADQKTSTSKSNIQDTIRPQKTFDLKPIINIPSKSDVSTKVIYSKAAKDLLDWGKSFAPAQNSRILDNSADLKPKTLQKTTTPLGDSNGKKSTLLELWTKRNALKYSTLKD
jgi:hypothetical protein